MTRDVKTTCRRRVTTSLVTRHPSLVTLPGLVAGILLIVAISFDVRSADTNKPAEFTSVDYYPVPNQMQMKSRMAGIDVITLDNGLYLIKRLRLEMFATNGQPQVIVNASECIYDAARQEANSPGRLSLQNGDGRIRIEGDGFLWRQTNALLTVSNQVRTTIQSDLKDKF